MESQTPLYYAALNVHEGVVRLLLEREEVSPGEPIPYRQTALEGAARNGHEGVVALLQPPTPTAHRTTQTLGYGNCHLTSHSELSLP